MEDSARWKRLVISAARVSERIAVWEVTAAQVIVVILGLIMTYGVVMRYAFRRGVPWAWELPAWLFLIIITLTLAYTQVKRKHVSVDLLVTKLPEKGKSILRVFGDLVFFAFCVILLRAAIIRLVADWVVHSEMTGFPFAPVLIILCIALASLMFRLLVDVGKEVLSFSEKTKTIGQELSLGGRE